MSTASASIPLPPPPDIVHRDFPGWLPPMLVKELRQGLRTRGFIGMMMIFHVLMLILMLGALSTQVTVQGSLRGANSASTGLFWTIIFLQLVIVTPMRAVGGLQLEVDSRTLDLLMLTRLNAWGVVLGKWISLVAQALLLVCTMLPYLVVRYFTDGADIIADLGRCFALVGVTAVLTAAGLWGSGLGKIMRLLLVVGFVWAAMGSAGVFGSRVFGVRVGPGAGAAGFSILDTPLDIFNAALITGFFLVCAVRNIAPPAENHSFLSRALPILAMLPVLFIPLVGSRILANQQLIFSGAFLALVLMFELASTRSPMASQRRAWTTSGPFFSWVGRAALPGWPSALAFGAVACAVWTTLAWLTLLDGSPNMEKITDHVVSLVPLAFAALLFPVVLRTFVARYSGPDLVFYFSAFCVPIVLLWIVYWLTGERISVDFWRAIVQTLPVASFVSAIDPSPAPRFAPSFLVSVFRGIFAMAVICLAAWQSRPYWSLLSIFDARARAERIRA